MIIESKQMAAELTERLTGLANNHPTMAQLVSDAITATGRELGSITLDELQAITSVAETKFALELAARHRAVEGIDFITIAAGKDFLETLKTTVEVFSRSSTELQLMKRTIERECPYTDDKVIEAALHSINTIAGNLAEQWDEMDSLLALYDLY